MIAGYGFGAAAAVLSPGGRVSRWLVAIGAVAGGAASLGLALEVFVDRRAVRPRGAHAPLGRGRPRVPARRPGRLLPRPRRSRRRSLRSLRSRVHRGLRRPLLAAAPRRHAQSVSPHHEPGPLRRQRADLPPDVGRHVAHVVLPRPDRDGRAGHHPGRRVVPGHDARGAGAGARRLPAPRGGRDHDRFRRSRAWRRPRCRRRPATWYSSWRSSASAPRRGSSRSTSGFPVPTRRRRATSPP